MALRSTDLMIGDWVLYIGDDEPKPMYVNALTELNQVFLLNSKFDVSSWILVGAKYITPIPLTPEILEKNGWYHGKFDGSYGRKAMRLDGLHKDKLPDGVDNALSFAQWSIDEKFEYHLLDVYLWKGSVHLWIEYVHELQHVFKLCGIDKEIVL